MANGDLTPEEEREARRLAEGPYGTEKSRFALRFTAPIFITTWDDQPFANQRNGTVTLVDLPDRRVGITCFHILDFYRERIGDNPETTLRIGNHDIELGERLVDESEALDLAVLDLGDIDSASLETDKPIGNAFHEPPKGWPPRAVTRGEALHLGGFPEAFRSQEGPVEVRAATLALAGQFVEAVGSSYIAVQFSREHWVGRGEGLQLRQLSGMSGGTGFVSRGEVERFELAGILCEFSGEWDIAYLRPTHLIRADGTLKDAV